MLSSRREYLIGGLCHKQRLLKLGRALTVLERGGRNDVEEREEEEREKLGLLTRPSMNETCPKRS